MNKIMIVGYGFVGKAVEYGFSTIDSEISIVDPLLNNSISDFYGYDIDVAFVCVPTPFGKDKSIDASIVCDVVEQLKALNCLIVIKSTITPDIAKSLANENDNIVYNPEFLMERSANIDFVNPPFHVFGGNTHSCERLLYLYNSSSRCAPAPHYIVSAQEASFVKYGINSFLASKVLWFNQFRDIVDNHGANYESIISVIGSDPRIGHSHSQVPGPDNRRGYGGACFPKDTNAFSQFANGQFEVLNTIIELNNNYRKQYDLDDREKEQKVQYD